MNFVKNAKFDFKGKTFNVNEVLGSSWGDGLFDAISATSNEPGGAGTQPVFADFLDKIYTAIRADLEESNGKARNIDDLIKSRVFEELDITPVVSSYSATNELDGMNSCSIQMGNLRDQFFTTPGSTANPVGRASYMGNTRAFQTSLNGQMVRVGQVGSYTTPRLFDLIRVWMYAGYVHPDKRTNEIRRLTALGSLPVTAEDFTFRPVFTGLVTDIEESNAAGGQSMINLRCSGMKRALYQSVTTFSDALAPVITTASPELGILQDRFTAFENNFTDMSGDAIIQKIFRDYFCVLDAIKSPEAGVTFDSSVSAGLPSLSAVLLKMTTPRPTVDELGNELVLKSNLIPMLPLVLAYHAMKLRFREPILTYDDRLRSSSFCVTDGSLFHEDDNAFSIDRVTKSNNLAAALKPYLLKVRSSFANYDSSYVSAGEVIDTIKDMTFMEMYEDKKGQFHFRFPRYNSAKTRHNLSLSRTLSAVVRRDDTAVFTACTAQRLIPFIGGNGMLDGRVFVDKFAVLRYGLRRPQTVENANATTERFARALAKFTRDYSAGRKSMSATVAIVGKPSIEPGEMVIFRTSRMQQKSENLSSGSSGSSGEKTYCGYVVSVTDSVKVSGQYVQTLNLEFVRDVSVGEATSSGERMGSPWDVVDSFGDYDGDNPASSGLISNVSGMSDAIRIARDPDVGRSIDLNESTAAGLVMDINFLSMYSAKAKYERSMSMRFIPSALDLAYESAVSENMLAAADAAALSKMDDSLLPSESDVKIAIDGLVAKVKARVYTLATYKQLTQILDAFLKEVKNAKSEILPKGKRNSGNVGSTSSNPDDIDLRVAESTAQNLTTKLLKNAHERMESSLKENNKGPARAISVNVQIGSEKGSGIIRDANGQTVPLSATIGDKDVLIPSINMKWVIKQVSEVYRIESQATTGDIIESYEKLYSNNGYAPSLPPGSGNSLSGDDATRAMNVILLIEKWASETHGALKGQETRDRVISGLASDIDKLTKSKDNIKARTKKKSSAISSAPKSNPAISATILNGTEGNDESIAHSSTIPEF